jgi:geranylgeranyl diphosphate synthase type II
LLVQEYFKSRKDIVENELNILLAIDDNYPVKLQEAMRYSVLNGGKRLRPLLLISTYEMLLGRKNISRLQRILPAAVAIELVHTASLIHDDLPSMDNSDERRGKPSCHVKFDPATAILAGDALITLAFETITKLKNKAQAIGCVKVLAKAISTRGMIGGQVVDVISEPRKTNINSLRYIHLKKTGSLLQAAMELACLLNDSEENVTITMSTFALNLGLAYQIVDDILDEVGSYDILGKETGQDSRNNRQTYTTLLGLEQAKKMAEKLLRDSYNLIKYMDNNEILVEFVNMIKERLP